MTQVSHPIDDSWVSEASDQYNRCLEIASQVQVDFIRTSNGADCFEKLVGALRIETGSAAVFVAATSDEGKPPRLRILATSLGVAGPGPDAAVWSAEVGASVDVLDGPLKMALRRQQPVAVHDVIASRYVMGIPLDVDGELLGLVGLSSERSFESDLPDRLDPLLETCSVLIDAARRSETPAGLLDEDTVMRVGSTSVQRTECDRLQLLDAILDNDPNYIAVVDADGVVQFINRVGSGYSIDSVIGTKVFDYQLPEFRRLSRKMLLRVFRDGQAVSVETLGREPNGSSERCFHVRAIPLKNEGVVESALLIATDLTEQKNIEDSTSRNDALLQAISEVSTEFIFVKDRKSRMVFCNSGASDFLGLTQQQQVGTDDSDFYPNTIARRIREDDLRVMATGRTRTYEEVLPSESGDRVFLTTKAPWRDSEGRMLGVVGLSQDITERKRTEQALAVSEARLRTIIDSEPSSVCLIGRDGTLLDINASGLRMAQAESIEELQGISMTRLFALECRDQFDSLHRRACLGEACDAQLEIVGLQGKRRMVEHHAVPFQYSPGQTVHLGITRDITAQHAAEEVIAQQQGQLMHVSRLSTMGQMVAAISHEITQPLSAISNFAAASSMLLGEEDSEAMIEEHVQAIQDQSERAGAIITRIRDFARRTEPHRSTCDLRKLVNDALELSRADLRRRAVTVEFASPEPTIFVLADAVQIQQVLMNFLSNACDAMHQQPADERRIWIRCGIDDTGVEPDGSDSSDSIPIVASATGKRLKYGRVEITDNGPGIDPDHISKLFDPFFTSKPQGMGIGLSICRDIIRTHRGSISAHQTADRGACFWFTLPSEGGAAE